MQTASEISLILVLTRRRLRKMILGYSSQGLCSLQFRIQDQGETLVIAKSQVRSHPCVFLVGEDERFRLGCVDSCCGSRDT